jgi:hypothetical protein
MVAKFFLLAHEIFLYGCVPKRELRTKKRATNPPRGRERVS